LTNNDDSNSIINPNQSQIETNDINFKQLINPNHVLQKFDDDSISNSLSKNMSEFYKSESDEKIKFKSSIEVLEALKEKINKLKIVKNIENKLCEAICRFGFSAGI